MNLRRKAQLLVNYLQSLADFEIVERNQYDHMGAIIVDTMLQPGAIYKAVKERRDRVKEYEEAKTTTGFLSLLNRQVSVQSFLEWKGRKPSWVLDLAVFLRGENVETTLDLQEWCQKPQNQERLLERPGFGLKTRDYLIKLAGLPSIPIDRHWHTALKGAGINYRDYGEAQRIVELAADIWQMDKSALDTSVWRYFSNFKGDGCL
jgi:hypothetical protein